MSKSLKTLELEALKSTVRFLTKKLKKLKERNTEFKYTLEQYRGINRDNNEAFNTLKNELEHYQGTVEGYKKLTDQLREQNLRFLENINTNIIFPDRMISEEFFKAVNERKHIQAIRIIKDKSNPVLAFDLTTAKNYYEKIFKKPDRVKQVGVFEPGDKVQVKREITIPPMNLVTNTEYVVSDVSQHDGAIALQGMNGYFQPKIFFHILE